MFICKNCGQTFEAYTNFCSSCGSNVIEPYNEAPAGGPGYYAAPGAPAAPTYSAPAYTTNPYSAPMYSAPYGAPAAPSKAPAIIGMIFGLTAILFAISTISNSITFLDYGDEEEALIFLFIMSIFQLPSIIVGAVQSFKARALRGMGVVGAITSLISAALWFITFIMILSEL